MRTTKVNILLNLSLSSFSQNQSDTGRTRYFIFVTQELQSDLNVCLSELRV